MTIMAVDRNAASHPANRPGRPSTTRASEVLEVLRMLRTNATGGETQGPEQSETHVRRLDIANTATALAIFEAEIEAIVEHTRQEAETIHQQALTHVRRIDGEAPLRVDEPGTRTRGRRHDPPESEQRSIMQRATADIERIHHDADAKIAQIVDIATALVWTAVTPGTALRVA